MSAAPEIDLTPLQTRILRDVFFRHAAKLCLAGGYGSRVHARVRPGSDVDLVAHGECQPGDIASMADDLEQSSLSVFAELSDHDRISHAPLCAQIDHWMRPLFMGEELTAEALARAA